MSDDHLWGDDNLFGDDVDEEEDEDNGGDDPNDWMNSNSGVAQHYLFLVDCNAEMWKKPTAGESAISQILSFLSAFVKSNLREQVMFHTGKRNGVSVLLYNTTNRTAKESAPASAIRGDYRKEHVEDTQVEDEEDFDDYYARDRKTTVHELIPMMKPGLETVQTLRKAQENVDELENDYAPTTDDDDEPPEYCPLQLALAEGIKSLEKAKFVKTKATPSAPQTDRVQIWIWSNQAEPHRAHDLPGQISDIKEDGNINLVLWGMPSGVDGTSLFDYSRFFDSLGESIQTPLREKSAEAMQSLYDTIMPELKTYWKPTRPLYRRLPLLLPDWREAATDKSNAYLLDWYRVVQVSKEPNKLTVSQETGRLVQSLTQVVTKENQDLLSERITGRKNNPKPSSRVRSFVPFGTDRVPMTADDKRLIKSASNSNPDFASLILIGFRPSSSVPELLTTQTPYVCMPSPLLSSEDAEEVRNHANNYQAISCLHQAMREENVVAIGELLTRVTSTSCLVALSPLTNDKLKKEEAEDGDDEQEDREWPEASFLAMPLPFADDIRAVKPQTVEVVEDEEDENNVDMDALVAAAAALVDKQTLQGQELGEDFHNAHLEAYWDYVERLAHQETMMNENNENDLMEEDTPRPDVFVDEEEILQAAGEEIAALTRLLPSEQAIKDKAAKKAAARKRKAAPPDESGIDWMDLYRSGEVSSCKVPQLKAKLKSLGELVSGKKADLVDRLTPHLHKEWQTLKQIKSEPDS